ncbi:hypothetical protein ACXR2T_12070 [Leucobacter sp. HY1910]
MNRTTEQLEFMTGRLEQVREQLRELDDKARWIAENTRPGIVTAWDQTAREIVNTRDALRRIEDKVSELRQRIANDTTIDEVAAEFGVTAAQVQGWLDLGRDLEAAYVSDYGYTADEVRDFLRLKTAPRRDDMKHGKL